MTSGRLPSIVMLMLWFLLPLGGPPARGDEEPKSRPAAADSRPPALDAPQVAALVQQLGDDSFQVRESAAAELTKLGEAAVAQLALGAESPAPEIRFRSKRLLSRIRSDRFQRLLAHFLSEVGREGEYDLPGWARYRARMGDSRASRNLFVEMQRAAPEVLRTYDAPGDELASLLTIRVRELTTNMQAGHQPSVGTVASLLLIASDDQVPIDATAFSMIGNLCHQQAFNVAMNEGASRPLLEKMLGAFILRGRKPELSSYVYSAFFLAMKFEIREEGLILAEWVVEGTQSAYKQYAVQLIAKLGTDKHVPLLESMLTDVTECSRRTTNKVEYKTQLRDVALAGCIHLSGESIREFGFEADVNDQSSTYILNAYMLGFENDAKRDAVFKKWRKYRAEHYAPRPPLEIISGTPG